MNTLIITKKKDYAIVQLNRGRANVINREMVKEIRECFQNLARDESVRGLVITGQPNFFSAGLDVIELYGYDYETIGNFFKEFGNMYIELAQFPKPVVSAITGHSPAGGTVIAITSDYRIMANDEKYTIGLNEVAVNIQISEDIISGYAFWIGSGRAHRYIMQGKLLNVNEALACGLVDEICPPEEVLSRAESKLENLLIADDEILRVTKSKLRKEWLGKLSSDGEKAFEQTMKTWWRPEIRAKIKTFVDALVNK